MPWLMQMGGCAVMILGIALAIWIGFWLIVVLGVISLCFAGWRYLQRKGIVSSTPGVPPVEGGVDVTIIDGDFTRVKDESKQIDQ